MSTWAHWRVYAIKAARWVVEAAVVVFLVVMIVAAAAVAHGQTIDIQIVYTGQHESATLGDPIECTSHLALCQYGLEDSPLGGREIFSRTIPDRPGATSTLVGVSLPFSATLHEYWQIDLELSAPARALGRLRLPVTLCDTPMRRGPRGIVRDGWSTCQAPRRYEVHPGWEGWVPGLVTGPWWSDLLGHDPVGGQLHIRLRWSPATEIFSGGFESGDTGRWSRAVP